jgi:hypothetical protein
LGEIAKLNPVRQHVWQNARGPNRHRILHAS